MLAGDGNYTWTWGARNYVRSRPQWGQLGTGVMIILLQPGQGMRLGLPRVTLPIPIAMTTPTAPITSSTPTIKMRMKDIPVAMLSTALPVSGAHLLKKLSRVLCAP